MMHKCAEEGHALQSDGSVPALSETLHYIGHMLGPPHKRAPLKSQQ